MELSRWNGSALAVPAALLASAVLSAHAATSEWRATLHA
jgi:hypothetical protein